MNIWRAFSLTIGRDIIVYQGDKVWQAKALDVIDNGQLLVETPDGQRKPYFRGDIHTRFR